MMETVRLPLTVLSDEFSLVKLDADEPIPEVVLRSPMCFVARTDDELSIVAPLGTLDSAAGRYRLLRIELVFGTNETGVLKRIADPLAAAGVWLLALGTHDRDYFLVRQDQFETAVAALRAAGHDVSEG